jgi:hypothetical protein
VIGWTVDTGVVGPRDRNTAGRPQNARPRDELGRPLPRDATGVDRAPEGVVLPPHETLDEAQRLIEAGQAFQAHEVLEAAWKAAPSSERELWRGLAQLAVGITHVQRGNATGAIALLRRAADRIDAYRAEPPHGVAVAALVVWARSLADDIAQDGLAPVSTMGPPLR